MIFLAIAEPAFPEAGLPDLPSLRACVKSRDGLTERAQPGWQIVVAMVPCVTKGSIAPGVLAGSDNEDFAIATIGAARASQVAHTRARRAFIFAWHSIPSIAEPFSVRFGGR